MKHSEETPFLFGEDWADEGWRPAKPYDFEGGIEPCHYEAFFSAGQVVHFSVFY